MDAVRDDPFPFQVFKELSDPAIIGIFSFFSLMQVILVELFDSDCIQF